MADPFTIAAIGTAATVAGGGVAAFGQLAGGDAKAAEFKYKAGVARLNAQIAKQNSEYALESGEKNAARKGLETMFVLGRQTVAQAANGFDVNSGTNVEVRESTQRLGYMDQGVIREEAGRKAYGYRIKGVQEESEAQANEYAAENAKSAAKIQALSTILGTAGSVAGKWYQGGSSFAGASQGITTYGPDFRATGHYA